jgi:hypothetical protein
MLFRVRACEPKHDGFMGTLVRLLIEQIAPIRERVVGGRCSVVGIRPAGRERSGSRIGHGEALGGKLGVRAVHQELALGLNLVFGVYVVYVIVHPGTIENEEAIRGIRGPKTLEL